MKWRIMVMILWIVIRPTLFTRIHGITKYFIRITNIVINLIVARGSHAILYVIHFNFHFRNVTHEFQASHSVIQSQTNGTCSFFRTRTSKQSCLFRNSSFSKYQSTIVNTYHVTDVNIEVFSMDFLLNTRSPRRWSDIITVQSRRPINDIQTIDNATPRRFPDEYRVSIIESILDTRYVNPYVSHVRDVKNVHTATTDVLSLAAITGRINQNEWLSLIAPPISFTSMRGTIYIYIYIYIHVCNGVRMCLHCPLVRRCRRTRPLVAKESSNCFQRTLSIDRSA